jgi:alkylation response protein AidB-like acyl-CoA dehydrogenase
MSNITVISETNRLMMDTVAKITADYGHNAYVAAARRGEDADQLWQTLGKAGLLGVHLPEEYGGGGQGVEALSLVLEETAAHGCPQLFLVAQTVIGHVLAKHGSHEQKQRWLTGMANGTAKLSFAVTEPDAGTNTHAISTRADRADRADGGWRINGQKYYITGADVAQAILVVARTSIDESTRRGRLSLFLVPRDAPGLSISRIPTEINVPDRPYNVFFDNVHIDDGSMIGEEGEGFKAAFAGLNPERIVVAGLCNGLSRYAISKATQYAKTRSVWGKPIGAHQGVAHPLADAYARLEVSRLMTQRAAQLYDSGENAGEASNIAKLTAADTAVFALDRAIQTHGGNGVASEYGLADLWFAARVQQIAPVSREMIFNFLAQHSLGLPKSY